MRPLQFFFAGNPIPVLTSGQAQDLPLQATVGVQFIEPVQKAGLMNQTPTIIKRKCRINATATFLLLTNFPISK
jgi:hypothetical protein